MEDLIVIIISALFTIAIFTIAVMADLGRWLA